MYVCNCNLKVHPTPTPSKNIFEFKHTNARTPIPTYRLLVQNKPTRHGSIIYSIQIKINPESCVVAIVVYLNSIYMRVQLQSCHIASGFYMHQASNNTNEFNNTLMPPTYLRLLVQSPHNIVPYVAPSKTKINPEPCIVAIVVYLNSTLHGWACNYDRVF